MLDLLANGGQGLFRYLLSVYLLGTLFTYLLLCVLLGLQASSLGPSVSRLSPAYDAYRPAPPPWYLLPSHFHFKRGCVLLL